MNEEENNMKNDILFQIDMQLYDEFNDTIATMNDNLGDIYSLRDVEEVEKAKKEKEVKLLREAIKKQQKEIEKKDNTIALLKVMNEELKHDFEEFKKDKDINYLDNNHHKVLVENSLGQKIDKPEECWFDAIEIKVIRNNILYGININKDFITLKEISDKHPEECITVIAESPLSGAIYRYNNYGNKEWQLIGSMIGYA